MVGALHSVAGAMFPGFRAEVSEILAPDFANLQVLHEALDQPGGIVSIADYVAARLGEEQMLVAHDLRQFKEHTSRDMERERSCSSSAWCGRGWRCTLKICKALSRAC